MLANRNLTALLLVAGLASAGCGAESSAPTLDSSLAPTGMASDALPFEWPPRRDRAYPDLALPNQRGQTVRLSSFAGKVLLIEPVGMT